MFRANNGTQIILTKIHVRLFRLRWNALSFDSANEVAELVRNQEEKYILRRHCIIIRTVKLPRVQIVDVIIIFMVSASCTH